jgi:capsid protein
MEEAVLRGRIIAPGFLEDPLKRMAWLENMWIGPTQGQIDPTKETTAAQARVDGHFSTIAIESAGLGYDFDQNIKQIKKERTKIAALPKIDNTVIKAVVDEPIDNTNEKIDNPLDEDVEDE